MRRGYYPRGCPLEWPEVIDGDLAEHRRSWWLLSCTEAPPVPFRRVLPSLLAVPSLACSVASLSLCPGGYLPDQHRLQSTGLAGCQIAWDTSSTWSGKRAQELWLLHLLVLSDRCQLEFQRFEHFCTSATHAQSPHRPTPFTDGPCRLPDCMGHAMRLQSDLSAILTLYAPLPNRRSAPTSSRPCCELISSQQAARLHYCMAWMRQRGAA